MTGLRARLLAEGREEGMEEGMEKGRQEARQEILQDLFIRLLSQRFGTPDEAILAMINEASTEELIRWAEKLMTARSLGEVFRTS